MQPFEEQLLPIPEVRGRQGSSRLYPTAWLVLVGLLLLTSFTNSVSAADFYVTPAGTTSTAPGTGTITNPWALQTALSQPAAVHAGDTIWLRGGTYTGNFTSHLTGTASQPIIVKQYAGERAKLDGNVNPSQSGSSAPVLKVDIFSGYTWFWGFEVTNSSPVRTDTPACTFCRGNGFDVFGPGTKIINCVVHDTGQGIGFWSAAVNAELYGNIIYYVGWSNPGGVGHSIYTQNNEGGSKLLKHNLLFDGFSFNLHAYGSPTAGFLNSRVDENVWWRGKSLVGGENGFDMGGTSITANFSWSAALNTGYSTTKCTNVTVGGNYLTNLGGAVFSPGSTGCRAGEAITTNTFVGDLSGFVQGDYPNNTYYAKTSPPTQDKVIILPNTYEPGRATIVIYNWDGSATQAVDLTGVLSPGAAYEIRNAQNFYGPAVVSGTYAGGSVTLPMTGLIPATPVGFAAPPSTGPAFAAFVVLSASPAAPVPPTASFTYSPAAPTVNAPVTFTDTSTGSPTTWQWSFGDGGTSTQRSPTHTYAGAGTYTVILTAANATGSNQTSRSLKVMLPSIPPTPAGFNTLTPCRVIDTRNTNGPAGGPALAAGSVRVFPVAGACGIPVGARTVSVNLTVTGAAAPGDLRVYPTDVGIPETWAISFQAGKARANNAMLTLATDGTGTIGVKNDAAGAVHVIVDANGYFR